MKAIRINTFILFALLFLACKTDKKKDQSTQKTTEKVERIISLNGTITEILVNLGLEDQIVATDITSMYPKSLKGKVKQLGHTRGITIEPVLAEKPTLIFSTEKGIPEKLKTQLEDAKIKVSYYKADKSVEGAKQLIKSIAKDLNKEEEAKKMIAEIDKDLQGVKEITKKPKVMFIYARGSGTLLVAGTDTPTEKMIALSGGVNAVTEYKEYKPLTTEAVIAANPDVLLFFTSGLQSLGGAEGLSKITALTKTTAVKKKQVITMDGLFLTGFGPRVGKAIKKLNEDLVKYAE